MVVSVVVWLELLPAKGKRSYNIIPVLYRFGSEFNTGNSWRSILMAQTSGS
jgi:hypothetical protein